MSTSTPLHLLFVLPCLENTQNKHPLISTHNSYSQCKFKFESDIQTKPGDVPLEVNQIEDKNKIQNDDCCGDCNSINCPHCDCSFW